MASFDYEMNESLKRLMQKLNSLDVAEVCVKAVDSAKDEVVKSTKTELSRHRKTGAMVNSIKATKPKRNNNGASCITRPTGKDSKGKRNMDKAMYLEIGTSKETAKPWRKKAINGCKDECKRKMKDVVDKEIK